MPDGSFGFYIFYTKKESSCVSRSLWIYGFFNISAAAGNYDRGLYAKLW
jgi:hypothetical protein